jgi:hypothetical protein
VQTGNSAYGGLAATWNRGIKEMEKDKKIYLTEKVRASG